MDPLSLIALGGIVFAGRTLSNTERYEEKPQPQPFFGNNINTPTDDGASGQLDIRAGQYTLPIQEQKHKHEVASFGVIAKDAGRNPSGQSVYNFYDRQPITTKSNNVQPMEKQYVGPGLGLNPEVPAYGGFQQLYRPMPNNVGAYKLTTLPGRSGPANPVVKSGRSQIGELTQERPEKTAALWDRRPPTRGRGQGQGGALTGFAGHENYERTKRQTNRSTTTMRDDGLQYAPAQHIVGAGPVSDMPSRNKGDLNTQRVNDVAAPGIRSFHGAYVSDPVLAAGGLRVADKRGQRDRAGNAGRMNVRGNPGVQGGMTTSMRSGAYRSIQGPMGPTGAANQAYQRERYQQVNAFKGNRDPRTADLGVAKRVNANNPLNINFS